MRSPRIKWKVKSGAEGVRLRQKRGEGNLERAASQNPRGLFQEEEIAFRPGNGAEMRADGDVRSCSLQ